MVREHDTTLVDQRRLGATPVCGWQMQQPFRIGHDVHGLFEGHPLVLGGVVVPSPSGFKTHSDGDVLSHTLVDALAGAIADGDLGTHFPEDDPEARDARSLDFVEHVAGLARSAGYEIANVDTFVVLGTTKLTPHLEGCARTWPVLWVSTPPRCR